MVLLLRSAGRAKCSERDGRAGPKQLDHLTSLPPRHARTGRAHCSTKHVKTDETTKSKKPIHHFQRQLSSLCCARIHFVALHLVPLMTGQPPWREAGSTVPSGLTLQNSTASPLRGFTARPCIEHSEPVWSLGLGALGKTVSPPSSTSLRRSRA